MSRAEWTVMVGLSSVITLCAWLNAIPATLKVFLLLALADILIYFALIIAKPRRRWKRELVARSAKRFAQFVLLASILWASTLVRQNGTTAEELQAALQVASQAVVLWGVGLVVLEMLESLSQLGVRMPKRLRDLFEQMGDVTNGGEEPS